MLNTDPYIENYCESYSQVEPEYLQALKKETKEALEMPQMLSGKIEGRFLKMLVQISGAKAILEIGTFSGYSALSMAEALPCDGHVYTCDLDHQAIQVARRYFEKSGIGDKITLCDGPAMDSIKKLNKQWDLVFLDADKEGYMDYYEAVIPQLVPGGLLVVDNALWSGEVLDPETLSAKTIHQLNVRAQSDGRVENVLLPIRDGIHLIRKV